MQIAKTVKELTAISAAHKHSDIGFVPTMGALHQGHLSLIKAAKNKSDFVIVSLFVNPLQFNNPEDLEKYPRNLQQDIEVVQDAGCNLLFAPSVEDIYPPGLQNITLDISHIDSKLEGKMRQGHFNGVVQVLHRLFSLIKPKAAFFGLKDFQQCLVVRELINTYFPTIALFLEPTVREPSGLAMSSRNLRLSQVGKNKAARIYRTLSFCKTLFPSRTPQAIETEGKALFNEHGIQVEYLAIAAMDDLDTPTHWEKNKKYIILAAVYIEGVRLIDNLILNS